MLFMMNLRLGLEDPKSRYTYINCNVSIVIILLLLLLLLLYICIYISVNKLGYVVISYILWELSTES